MIIGTAGHIDHGKSALVRALTGREMDPLAEERRRGITLDLHFAPLPLPDGRVAGVIDVPGHEDLIRTMVAGAAGLDLVLLIVAADEGIMPQTREHLAIVEQLRVPAGIPVLTKADLVEPEWLALVEEELTAWLAASPVPFGAPVVTSAASGAGVEELRGRITALAGNVSPRSATDLFRLPVDRALSLPGAGTVVTGTAWSGRLRVGDQVRLLPGGAEGRVRSLERHGETIAESAPGDRVAAALVGIDREQARRGTVLVRAGDPWRPASALDVELELLPGAPGPLAHHARVRVHHGTMEVLARVQLTGLLAPGSRTLARLALEQPLVARGGDRFVVRRYSPVETIGGGWVVDPLPPRGRPRWPDGINSADAGRRLGALVRRRAGGLEESALPVVLGREGGAEAYREAAVVVAGGFLLDPAEIESAVAAVTTMVAEHHRARPAEGGIPLETVRQALGRRGAAAGAALDQLIGSGRMRLSHGLLAEPGFEARVPGGAQAIDRAVAAVEGAGLTPPTAAELESQLGLKAMAEVLRAAGKSGRLLMVEPDRYYSPAALEQFRAALAEAGANGPITPTVLRERLGLSRRFLIPLLEWADRTGLTRREGEARVWIERTNGA